LKMITSKTVLSSFYKMQDHLALHRELGDDEKSTNLYIIFNYIKQQEKVNELLDLYRLGYSGSILSFIAYRDKIKKLEKELKTNG